MEEGRTLVTGGGGFVGSWVAGTLDRCGERVRILTRAPHVPRRAARLGLEVHVGDVRDRRAVRRAVEGCRRVHHVAALFRREAADEGEYWDVNVGGTRHVLETAAELGVERVVHCSTVGVHGEIVGPPACEEAPFAPDHPYEETKLAAERLALEVGRSRGLPVAVARPTGVYGPGDLRLLKLFSMIARGRFALLGDGSALTHLVYVTDLVEGMRLLATHPAAAGRSFILGGDQPVSVRELSHAVAETLGVPPPRLRLPAGPLLAAADVVERASRILGVSPPIYRRRLEFFVKNRAYDISLAREALGYRPRVDLATGLRRTAGWYRRRGLVATPPAPSLRLAPAPAPALAAGRLAVPLQLVAEAIHV